jgi:hypothetical protein
VKKASSARADGSSAASLDAGAPAAGACPSVMSAASTAAYELLAVDEHAAAPASPAKPALNRKRLLQRAALVGIVVLGFAWLWSTFAVSPSRGEKTPEVPTEIGKPSAPGDIVNDTKPDMSGGKHSVG